MEPMYLNPLMPYHVAEHHLGDLDNNTIGFDMTLFPAARHKLYMELFVDDFTTSENPFTYYGNKWAMLAGWRWVDCFGLDSWDARIEYARIEPYVYTHTDSINIYQDYGQPLGHWLGPDSDAWTGRIGWLPARTFLTEIFAQRIRHGEGSLHSPAMSLSADGNIFCREPLKPPGKQVCPRTSSSSGTVISGHSIPFVTCRT